MKRLLITVLNERGFILVTAMLTMVVLTIIGVSATNMTEVELQIAGNDRMAKEAFYYADGGTEVGIELVEENVACPDGFKTAPGGFDSTDARIASLFRIGGIQVADIKFMYDEEVAQIATDPTATPPATTDDIPTDTARTIRIPTDLLNPSDDNPHTNLAILNSTGLVPGGSVEMARGYDGVGFNLSGGGASLDVDIYSQRFGMRNTVADLRLGWRHLIRQNYECRY